MTRLADFYRLFPQHLATLAAAPSPKHRERTESPAAGREPARYQPRRMGTGYGRSSGYATPASYGSAPSALLVRVR